MKTLLTKKRSAPVLGKPPKDDGHLPLSSIKEIDETYKTFAIENRKKMNGYLSEIEKSTAKFSSHLNLGNVQRPSLARPQSTMIRTSNPMLGSQARHTQGSKMTSRSSSSFGTTQPKESSTNFLSRQAARPYVVGPRLSSMSLLSVPILSDAAQLKAIFGVEVPKSLPEDQRAQFVLKQLEDRLKHELKEIFDREAEREGAAGEMGSGENFEAMMHRLMEFEEGDVGAWIRLNSQYKALGKKVQARLVEFLSDELNYKKYDVKLSYDHVEQLDEYYEHLMSELEHEQIEMDAAQKKIELPINYLMRKRVKEERLLSANTDELNLEVSKVDAKNKSGPKVVTAKIPTIKRKAEKFAQDVDTDLAKIKMKTEEVKTRPTTATSVGHLTTGSAQTELARSLNWTKSNEQDYKTSQSQAKHLFSSSTPSSHYRDVGFAPTYLSLRKQSNLHNLQNFLLEKLQSGEWLTSQELRHILFSSKLTRAVLDKDYFKKATGVLSPEVKGEIIGLVADEIIKDYYSVLEQIKNARKSYLRQKNNEHKQKLAAFLAQLEKENESMLRVVDLKRWRASNWRYCRKMALLVSRRQKDDATSRSRGSMSPGRKKSGPKLINQAESDMEKFIREKRKINRNKFLRRNFQKPVNSNVLGLIQPKDLRHLQNPSSKIFKLPNQGTTPTDLRAFEKEAEQAMQDMYDYKNSIVDQNGQKPERFKRLYSGGPVSRRKEAKTMAPNQAALLIQKVWRGFFERRMVNMLKNAMYHKKQDPKAKKIKSTKQATPQEQGGVSKFYANLVELKQSLLNPQNEQKLKLKNMEESKTKNRRDFNRKIDDSIRQKILNSVKRKEDTFTEIPVVLPQQILEAEKEDSGEETDSNINPKKTIYTKNNLHIKQMALLNACKNNKANVIRNSAFEYSKHDSNTMDADGNTPLFYASKHANQYLVNYLLRKGASVNKKCSNGNTAVHAAFMQKKTNESEQDLTNQAEVIKMLVNFGGNLDALNDAGQTPVYFGVAKLLKMLHLYGGISTVAAKLDKNAHPPRHHNRGLFFESCDKEPAAQFALYEMKRCTSAATLKPHPILEHYRLDPKGGDIFSRRKAYVESGEFDKLLAESETLLTKSAQFV